MSAQEISKADIAMSNQAVQQEFHKALQKLWKDEKEITSIS